VSGPIDTQDVAYERAVATARADPAMRGLVERAFLHADASQALAAFRASEDYARVRRLLGEAGVEPPARVLDFGGGRGLLAAALAADGFQAALCEPNPSDVCGTGAAAAVLEAAPAPFDIVASNVSDLPAGTFDAVACRAVLHHVEPLTGVLRAVHGVLRPGGAFVAADEPTIRREGQRRAAIERHPFVRFGVEEDAHPVEHYVSALREAGFREVEYRFPVAWSDYRRHVRRGDPVALVALLYARYRLREALGPEPGAVRSLIARGA